MKGAIDDANIAEAEAKEPKGFRPSSLPKLALCPKYVGSEPTGGYADRGTRMDVAFRESIITGTVPVLEDQEELAAVIWAATTAKLLARGSYLEARESELKVDPGCGVNPGTADLLCEGQRWSSDLKSGQVRNYMEQQRAYALGFMDRFFVDDWTVYLLFCDERLLVTLKFTREEAMAGQRSLVASVLDPYAAEQPNDYCDWCANRWKCQTRMESVAWFLGLDPATIDLMAYANDPEKVGALLALTHDIAKDDGAHDVLKAGALGLIMAGKPVEGWKAQAGRKTETVESIQINQLIELIGAPRVLSLMGNITASKFRAMWELAKGAEEPVPAGLIKESHGSAFLVKSKPKKEKATKTKTETKTEGDE